MGRFQILTPGGLQYIDNHVGEKVNLECNSTCGDLYWFVNGEKVIRDGALKNSSATANAISMCVNDDNSCGHESYIDCCNNYTDGRMLHSVLTFTPTEEDNFLIQCEADLYRVEIRKSVLLTARSTLL